MEKQNVIVEDMERAGYRFSSIRRIRKLIIINYLDLKLYPERSLKLVSEHISQITRSLRCFTSTNNLLISLPYT